MRESLSGVSQGSNEEEAVCGRCNGEGVSWKSEWSGNREVEKVRACSCPLGEPWEAVFRGTIVIPVN